LAISSRDFFRPARNVRCPGPIRRATDEQPSHKKEIAMSKPDRTPLEKLGYYMNEADLIEQAKVIGSIALTELDLFKAQNLLTEDALTNLNMHIVAVQNSLQTRTLAVTEVRMATRDQARAHRKLQEESRRIALCVKRQFRARPELTRFGQGGYRGRNIGKFCTDLVRRLAFAKEHVAELTPKGATTEYLMAVENQTHDLENASAKKEATTRALPGVTRQLNEAKGRLLLDILDIANAGQSLHAGDRASAAKYNLKILRRRGKAKVTQFAPAPAQTAPVIAPTLVTVPATQAAA
jgi:hypothetical protein